MTAQGDALPDLALNILIASMRKLLILGLLGLIFYFFLQNRRKVRENSSPPEAQKMVSCAQCGVHLPESESLPSGGRNYCCEEHRGLGPRERGN